ncbi:hypothetical protein IV203_037715 [Nitzschia inconspicua]|uniref:Uncharacterized protein n=1 Tax=Nitzschia inconspicua TaxID=303405 RepID=A0A9K3PYM7_9STRA|nr:hypothetical protein IV203_037715 [Nitzschia inconspicua]
MKQSQLISSVLFLFSAVPVFGWTEATTQSSHLSTRARVLRRSFAEIALQESAAEPNPCWQDMYDEDCAMETIFAARYVASDWIKNLPCAKGLEDCDFPEDIRVPEIRPESHPEEINVMEFLNIKRAKSVEENAAKEAKDQ